ncbi:endonuclease/exonuclease/phosphatase family protein [Streptomyces sp. NPDC088387]|uniref:endonuclease/exonuclease/phosphatase family protein n=1 Tax=Streptomyces sp. NPDC088387 TaxID=3365859 RepID=UPI003828B4DE
MTQVDTAETGQDETRQGESRQRVTRQGEADREITGGPGSHRALATRSLRTRIRRTVRRAARPEPWKRGRLLAGLALLLGLVMMLHAWIPNRIGNLGSLVETFLPWLGVFVPALLACALWRRSASAVVALLLPSLVWLSLFGGVLSDKSRPGGDLTVASHNVGADNPDPAGTARDLIASGADVLALEEITPQALGTYEQELATAYPFHEVQGTVGLWSRLPLSDTRAVDVKMDAGALAATLPDDVQAEYSRGLRTTVATDQGPLAVYVAHLGSVRVNPRSGLSAGRRNAGAQSLGEAVAADRSERVVLLGDLNGSTDDRAFADLTSGMRSAQDAAGDGFGFTWPVEFPVIRIDQILVRGVDPTRSWVLPSTGSDHLPVAAEISW